MREKMLSQRKMCLVSKCPYNRVSKGLCTKHYNDQRVLGKYQTEAAVFEIEAYHQPPPLGYNPYKDRLQALARAVPEWNKKQRVSFVDAMLTKYRGELEV